jgi:hypothetical protein
MLAMNTGMVVVFGMEPGLRKMNLLQLIIVDYVQITGILMDSLAIAFG